MIYGLGRSELREKHMPTKRNSPLSSSAKPSGLIPERFMIQFFEIHSGLFDGAGQGCYHESGSETIMRRKGTVPFRLRWGMKDA